MNSVAIILTVSLLLSLPAQTEGKVIRVPADSTTVQRGIDGAVSGDTVLVAPGIYSASTNGESFPLSMKGGIVLMSESGADETWLNAEEKSRVIDCLDVDILTEIIGFKIYRGVADEGGGIRCENSVLRLVDNEISDNQADLGAGVYSSGCTLESTRNLISSNKCTAGSYRVARGAGIYSINTALNLYENTITGNRIHMYGHYPEGYGAGVYCQNSLLLMQGNSVKKNTFFAQWNHLWGALAYGGGIYCKVSNNAEITGNIIDSNACPVFYSSDARGGGIFLTGCVQPKIKYNLILGNRVEGGSYNAGGGIFIDNSFTDSVVNNTLVANVGDGIYAKFSDIRITNNIVVTSLAGGGIVSGTGSELTVSYNDVWNNESGNFNGCENSTGDTTWGDNANGTPCDQFYNIVRDPLFIADPGNAYSLQEASPCINAGDPSGASDPDGTTTDIGAFYCFVETDVGDEDEHPSVPYLELRQNYPNPFNPTTKIDYRLSRRCHVGLTVYDLLGRKVRTLVDQEESVGNHNACWDGTDGSGAKVSSGVYFYRLRAGDMTESKKMVLLK